MREKCIPLYGSRPLQLSSHTLQEAMDLAEAIRVHSVVRPVDHTPQEATAPTHHTAPTAATGHTVATDHTAAMDPTAASLLTSTRGATLRLSREESITLSGISAMLFTDKKSDTFRARKMTPTFSVDCWSDQRSAESR